MKASGEDPHGVGVADEGDSKSATLTYLLLDTGSPRIHFMYTRATRIPAWEIRLRFCRPSSVSARPLLPSLCSDLHESLLAKLRAEDAIEGEESPRQCLALPSHRRALAVQHSLARTAKLRAQRNLLARAGPALAGRGIRERFGFAFRLRNHGRGGGAAAGWPRGGLGGLGVGVG